MSSRPVTIEEVVYTQVLSVLDVFSRNFWLRAIPTAASSGVAEEIYKLYMEFGPPQKLQSDQGVEFKGNVKEFCKKLHV